MKRRNVTFCVFKLALFLFSAIIIVISLPFFTQAYESVALPPSSIRPDNLRVTTTRDIWGTGDGETLSFFISNDSDISIDLWRVEIPLERDAQIREHWWREDVEVRVRNNSVLVIRGSYSIEPNSTYNGGCNLVYLEDSNPTSTPTPTTRPTVTSTPTPTSSPVVSVVPTPTSTPTPTPTSTPTPEIEDTPHATPPSSSGSDDTTEETRGGTNRSNDDESALVNENDMNDLQAFNDVNHLSEGSVDLEDDNRLQLDQYDDYAPIAQEDDDANIPAGLISDDPDSSSGDSGLGANILQEGASRSSSDNSFLWPLVIIIAATLGGIVAIMILKKKREKEQKRPIAALVGDFIYGANEEARNAINNRIKPFLAGVVGKLKGGSFDQSFAEAQASGTSGEMRITNEEQANNNVEDQYSDAHRMRPPKK